MDNNFAEGEVKIREIELEIQLALLQAAAKNENSTEQALSLADPGSQTNYGVFKDANGDFRAIVDKIRDDDLTQAKALASYRVHREYDIRSESVPLTYCVNILDNNFAEGEIDLSKIKLSIVTESGSHGTHVASILVGFHQGKPVLRGIAPGAQVISLKIGDGRIDGMETSKSIVRAIRAAVQ